MSFKQIKYSVSSETQRAIDLYALRQLSRPIKPAHKTAA